MYSDICETAKSNIHKMQVFLIHENVYQEKINKFTENIFSPYYNVAGLTGIDLIFGILFNDDKWQIELWFCLMFIILKRNKVNYKDSHMFKHEEKKCATDLPD